MQNSYSEIIKVAASTVEPPSQLAESVFSILKLIKSVLRASMKTDNSEQLFLHNLKMSLNDCLFFC